MIIKTARAERNVRGKEKNHALISPSPEEVDHEKKRGSPLTVMRRRVRICTYDDAIVVAFKFHLLTMRVNISSHTEPRCTYHGIGVER